MSTLRRVAVTGASGQVGSQLVAELGRNRIEVVPCNRDDHWCRKTVAVDAMVHLAGALRPRHDDDYVGANVTTTERALQAVRANRIDRLVVVSYVGADPGSRNDYLRSKGRAEALVSEAGIASLIIRSPHLIGGPNAPGPTASAFQSSDGRPVMVPGDGSQAVAPLLVDDLVAMLMAAVTDKPEITGIREVSGPETMRFDDLVALVNDGDVRIRHVPAAIARLSARFRRSLTPALIDVLASDSLSREDPVEVAAQFGVALQPPSDPWSQRTKDRRRDAHALR